MAFINKSEKLVMIDLRKGLLIYDLKMNQLSFWNPQNGLKQPTALFVSSNKSGKIYIYDCEVKKIFVFNEEFVLLDKIGSDLKYSSFISMDSESFLYISHTSYDEVSVLNTESGKLDVLRDIERPCDIRFKEKLLFILSKAEFEGLKIQRGNFIYAINKESLQVIKKIQLENWFNPLSLNIDSNSNIYTIAQYFDNATKSLSAFQLYIFDKEYKLSKKIKLEKIKAVRDNLYLDNKIITFVDSNQIAIVDFN